VEYESLGICKRRPSIEVVLGVPKNEMLDIKHLLNALEMFLQNDG